MRLGQAARKFETTTDKLVKILAEEFREVNDHPNIKLTDEEVAYFEALYQPKAKEEVESIVPNKEETTSLELPEAEKEEKEENIEPSEEKPELVDSLRPQVFTLENEFTEKTKSLEKYKAEKPALDGLKVLGKIDLPEPKPKEEKESKAERSEKRQQERRKREDRKQRHHKNAAIEERKRQERIAKRKKVEAEKREKELKKKHYEKQVKAKLQAQQPKKKKKKVTKEQVNSNSSRPTTSQQQPTKKAKGLKRLWLWLNGAYDKY